MRKAQGPLHASGPEAHADTLRAVLVQRSGACRSRGRISGSISVEALFLAAYDQDLVNLLARDAVENTEEELLFCYLFGSAIV